MFDDKELRNIYLILRLYDEGLTENPAEDWESDYYYPSLPDKKGIKAILKKIVKKLPEEESEDINKAFLRRRYDTFNNRIDDSVYRVIEKAFDNKKTVNIGYFDMSSAEVREREIDVYHKTRRYVIAYCHLRKAMRKFRTSRIVKAKLSGKRYSIPADFDKNNI